MRVLRARGRGSLADAALPRRSLKGEARTGYSVGMRRPLLAAALALAAGLAWSAARADEGAYGSLVGAARSASEEAAPDLGGSPAPDTTLKDALNDSGVRAPRVVR